MSRNTRRYELTNIVAHLFGRRCQTGNGSGAAARGRSNGPIRALYLDGTQIGANLDARAIRVTGEGRLRDLGVLGSTTLLLNSMGDRPGRAQYADVLRRYLLEHGQSLGDEFRARAEANPLRVLDSKDPAWQDVIERAPQLTEHLSDASRVHFEQVQRGLDEDLAKGVLCPHTALPRWDIAERL